jgi:DNA modification methylase
MGDLEGNYATDYEIAIFCVKGKVKFKNGRPMAVWKIDKDSSSSYVHPTQKPVALAQKAIEDLTLQNNSVLDLFGGSGSTLIACEKTNRKCFMMELDPKYCDVIVKRWEQFTGKKAYLNEEQ